MLLLEGPGPEWIMGHGGNPDAPNSAIAIYRLLSQEFPRVSTSYGSPSAQ